MMTRTDRRRFPILLAAIAALALAMALLFSTVQAQEGSAPDKPRGLSATASHDQVVLTWDNLGDASITGYVILRRVRENDTGGKFSELVPDTGSAATTYTDDTVVAETTYTYRIKAINEHGVSERSRWSHIDIPAAPAPEEEQAAEPPDKPTGLSATASHDAITLTWDDPGDDTITGYVILRRNRQSTVSGQFSELAPDTGSAATTYSDDTVAAETNYTYRIKAINEHGVSERSRWFHIDTPAAPEAVEGDDQDGEDGGGAPGHATPPGPGGRANVSEPDGEDLPTTTSTTGEVDVGGSVTGNIANSTDLDWFAVVLEAGKTYQIDLKGENGGGGTLKDPLLDNIRDSSGTEIEGTSNDDVDYDNDIYDSQITFTPTAAGTHYLVASRAGSSTGTYTLSVREIACTLNTGDIWCGVVTVGELKSNANVLVAHGFAATSSLSAGGLVGYPDDTMFSVGDNDYTIRGLYVGAPGGNNDGSLSFLLTVDLSDDDKENLVLKIDGVTTDRALSDAGRLSAGLYSWVNTDLDWSSETTVTVRLQGPTTSDDPPDDSADPPEGGFREGDTDLPANADTTGVVEVDGFGARGAIFKPIGTSIDIGTTNDPEISTTYVFDTDWFAVDLETGRTYRIDMKGQILSSPGLDTPGEPVDPELTLSLPQINAIYDADGGYLLNTWGADESSAHHLFRVTFHAHAGGTYYIAASGESFEWGGYELTVIDITDNPD